MLTAFDVKFRQPQVDLRLQMRRGERCSGLVGCLKQNEVSIGIATPTSNCGGPPCRFTVNGRVNGFNV